MPYNYPYHQTLVYKLMNARKPDNVLVDFEQSLDVIRRTHQFSCGVPQIVYLTGWQYDGHDSKYPAFFEVNPRLKREQDATARDSLLWLMREARQYNAIVSLHINMCDAYENSPLWEEYIDKDLLRRNADGSLFKALIWDGDQAYHVNKTREWQSGLGQRRLDALLELLPIQEQGTLHIDVFNSHPSEFHGTSEAQEYETLRSILSYLRERGVDTTIEWFKPELAGLIPMVYHFNLDERGRLSYPPTLVCGGGDAWNQRNRAAARDWSWFPENGCLYEEAWGRSIDREPLMDGDDLAVFAESFFTRTLPWLFLNQQEATHHLHTAQSYEVHYGNDVSTSVNQKNRHFTLKSGKDVLVDGNDVLLPAPWTGAGWIAYSQQGGRLRWPIPPQWARLSRVDSQVLWQDTPQSGEAAIPHPMTSNPLIEGNTLCLDLTAGEAVVLFPHFK